jgi:hypothetical protein
MRLAILVSFGICLVGLSSQRAFAETPTPDPKPVPIPKADPKPKPPKQAQPPPAPPTPPPPAPSPPPPPAVEPPPPPPAARSVAPATKPTTKTGLRQPVRRVAVPRARRTSKLAARSKPYDRRRELGILDQPSADLSVSPSVALTRAGAPVAGSLPVIVPLLGFGLLLLLGAAALTSRRAPVPRIAAPLYQHRSDLVLVGAGAIAVALLWLNIAALL